MTKVTAIIWSGLLEQAEAVLQELGVAGVIIQPVREYNRFGQLPREQRTDHLKIEFFVADDRALVIVAPFGVAPDVRLYYLAGLLLSVLGLLGVSSVNACL